MPGAGVGHSFANTGGNDFDVVGTTMQNGFRRFTFLALSFGNGKTACNVHIHFANCGLPLRAARVLGAYLSFVIFTDTFVDISTCSFASGVVLLFKRVRLKRADGGGDGTRPFHCEP